eukprot:5618290-Prymnesium_polylepis.1
MVGEITDWAEKEPSKQTFNITVADNQVFDLPREFHGAVSVTLFIAAGSRVLHNAIDGSSYSAISCGWGWHTKVGNESYARENLIVGNAISNSMQLLFDGGDIYTLGSQPGSVVAFNHVHGHGNCVKTVALYHDDGSAHFVDHGNVIQLKSTCPEGAAWVSLWTPFIHDVHVRANFADIVAASNAGTNCTITGTTLVNTTLPPAAQAIVDQSGPRDASPGGSG